MTFISKSPIVLKVGEYVGVLFATNKIVIPASKTSQVSRTNTYHSSVTLNPQNQYSIKIIKMDTTRCYEYPDLRRGQMS